MSSDSVVDTIRSRGYWEVAVHPTEFLAEQLTYDELETCIRRSVVRLRGWPVPFIEHREPLRYGEDYVGQDIDALRVAHYEAWRLFMSGQFTQLRAIGADWRTGSEATFIPPGSDSVIEVWEILFFLTEIFELAARLTLNGAGGDRMTVTATLHGIQGRRLVVGTRRRASFQRLYAATLPTLSQTMTLSRDELVARPGLAAAAMSREFFLRFGWQPSLDHLTDYQSELVES